MSPRAQRRITLLAAGAGVALFLAANAHLVAVAFDSQPACATISPDRAPARPAC